VTPGLVALAVTLAIALMSGVVWRLLNGRMRGPRAPLLRVDNRQGVQLTGEAQADDVLTGGQLGHSLGEVATLVQFSSAFCAPCRATRRILSDVAGLIDGVSHVEIDAESRMDLVRDLNVLRTPTVLVLAADGRIVRRASGQPRKPDVIAAIGAATDSRFRSVAPAEPSPDSYA
jgi:thiol-disulfide isomerase/thioredoxin